MERGIQYLIIAVFVIALIASGIYVFFNRMKADSYESEYVYEISIDTDTKLNNLTMIIPLPTHNSESKIGEKIIHGDIYNPNGWTFNLMESNGTVMLRIHSGSFDQEDSLILRANMSSKKEIDTKSPLENEPILEPKNDLKHVEYNQPHPEEWDDRLHRYTYKSPIYLEYESEEVPEIDISIDLNGSNNWWMLGWNGNEYWDRIILQIDNGKRGWFEGQGELVEGHGNY